ncbi:hypothetical protein GJ496_004400 [Pomphorhynchus laevis]|nr:hypothetical protein GJ496_004400 [Pomphorhynchus laevis]
MHDFGYASNKLANALAKFATLIATKQINNEVLTAFPACRLIAIDKIPGDAIQKELIPKILGKVSTSSEEEVIYGLPLRDGGLGIRDPTIDTSLEYSRSLRICQPFLTGKSAEECIEEEHSIFKSLRDEESIKVKEKLSTLQDKLSLEVRVVLKFVSEKDASSWLRMPYLNDKESKICLEDGDDTILCTCGKSADIAHVLSCKTGGFNFIRHELVSEHIHQSLKECCSCVEK